MWQVVQRPDKQMFISNQSLVLQKVRDGGESSLWRRCWCWCWWRKMQVSREQAGNYSCHASNVEGDAESDPVTLTIMCTSHFDDDLDYLSFNDDAESEPVTLTIICMWVNLSLLNLLHIWNISHNFIQMCPCATMTSRRFMESLRMKPSLSAAPSKATLLRWFIMFACCCCCCCCCCIGLSKVSFTWSFNNSLTSSLLPTNSYTQEAGTSTIT